MIQPRVIPLVFITDEGFIMQTSVAITSLLGTKASGTEYRIHVVAAECSASALEPLRGLPSVSIIEVSLDGYRQIRQLAHIPVSCLLKFAVCELVPEYDKLLYLDGDIVVRTDLADMFDIALGENYAAAVFARRELGDPRIKINAGVMLFNAEKMRREGMREKLLDFRLGLGDRGSMDQQTFNLMLGERILPLDVRYNCMPAQFMDDVERKGMDNLNELLGTGYESLDALVTDSSIIHYSTGFKPWKYRHAPCAEEWYAWYRKSPFGHRSLKRRGRLGQYVDILADEYRQGGAAAVAKRLACAVWHRLIGRKPETVWG